jgi:hypothetical protein
MEIKGTAVKSIPEFVQKQFPLKYKEWLDALPESSKKLMGGLIFTNNWYPIQDSLVIPMKAISKVFYNGDDIQTARTMGRFSADLALTGVYKFFIQLGSPKYIMERAGRVFTTYFQPSEIVVLNASKNGLVLHITKFPEPEEIVEHNIAGWMERALEKSGCKSVKVEITKSLTKHQNITEFIISWL